jgi:hypothetical protein
MTQTYKPEGIFDAALASVVILDGLDEQDGEQDRYAALVENLTYITEYVNLPIPQSSRYLLQKHATKFAGNSTSVQANGASLAYIGIDSSTIESTIRSFLLSLQKSKLDVNSGPSIAVRNLCMKLLNTARIQ